MSHLTVPAGASGQLITNISGEGVLEALTHPLVVSATRFLVYNSSTSPVAIRSTHEGEGGGGSDGTYLADQTCAVALPQAYTLMSKRASNTHLSLVLGTGGEANADIVIFPAVT